MWLQRTFSTCVAWTTFMMIFWSLPAPFSFHWLFMEKCSLDLNVSFSYKFATKFIQVWNEMSMNKWWQIIFSFFFLKCSFKPRHPPLFNISFVPLWAFVAFCSYPLVFSVFSAAWGLGTELRTGADCSLLMYALMLVCTPACIQSVSNHRSNSKTRSSRI